MTTVTTLLVACEALTTTVLFLCIKIQVNLCQERQSATCLMRPCGGPQVVVHVSGSGSDALRLNQQHGKKQAAKIACDPKIGN